MLFSRASITDCLLNTIIVSQDFICSLIDFESRDLVYIDQKQLIICRYVLKSKELTIRFQHTGKQFSGYIFDSGFSHIKMRLRLFLYASISICFARSLNSNDKELEKGGRQRMTFVEKQTFAQPATAGASMVSKVAKPSRVPSAIPMASSAQ